MTSAGYNAMLPARRTLHCTARITTGIPVRDLSTGCGSDHLFQRAVNRQFGHAGRVGQRDDGAHQRGEILRRDR
jgi:hypothetical protein